MDQIEPGAIIIVPQSTNVRKLVDRLCAEARSGVDENDIQFTCFISETIPSELILDGAHFEQALDNLLSNAVKFTQKGRIHVHVTLGGPDSEGICDLTVIVADTGCGIKPEAIPRLFQPFAPSIEATKLNQGGIGLAVTRGLARLMGGDISVNSADGRGSEFTMVLKSRLANESSKVADPIDQMSNIGTAQEFNLDTPAHQDAIQFDDDDDEEFETLSDSSSNAAPVLGANERSVIEHTENSRLGFSRQSQRSDFADIAPEQLNGLSILIVEDVVANLEVLCSLLAPVGCTVSCAENGKIALEMMKSQTFDAVLMDIRMPIMDGVAATKAIRNLPEPQCHTAIIALTADASAENNAECLAAGADVFLTKPVIVSELFSSIRFARRKQIRQKDQELSA